jgi:hypothetical protein
VASASASRTEDRAGPDLGHRFTVNHHVEHTVEEQVELVAERALVGERRAFFTVRSSGFSEPGELASTDASSAS